MARCYTCQNRLQLMGVKKMSANQKKNLRHRIRGWLPKEPSLSASNVTTKLRVNNPVQPASRRERLLGGLGAGLGALGGTFVFEYIAGYFLTQTTRTFLDILLIIGVISLAVAVSATISAKTIEDKRKHKR